MDNDLVTGKMAVKTLNKFNDRVIIMEARSVEDRPSFSGSTPAECSLDDDELDANDLGIESNAEVAQEEDETAASSDSNMLVTELSPQFDNSYMEAFLKIMNLDRSEAVVTQILSHMPWLEEVLKQDPDNPDCQVWLQKIADLKEKSRYKRTVVGVVGVTGAGKSSVLNALLGEEIVVPTNGMRACTAVPTELSWNKFEEPTKKYRAVIEFVNENDWRRELEILLDEIAEDPKSVTANDDSEAGVALAKVKAVYPAITKDDLAKVFSVDDLLDVPWVRHHLGGVRRIKGASAEEFYEALQRYIDTSADESETTARRGPKQPELWPLVKCVKIYLRAEALSTGATVVDLPGVQDSNPARAAVADRYMRQCSALWVVAPITRAVNDKAAKDLLGDHFKRQMKFDGLISSVTFICSKTDEISVKETKLTLNLQEELDAAQAEHKGHQATKLALTEKEASATARIAELLISVKGTQAEIRTWNNLKRQHQQGRPVWAPESSTSKKRKQVVAVLAQPRKKVRENEPEAGAARAGVEDDPFKPLDDNEDEDDDEVDIVPALTEDEILANIQRLKTVEANTIREASKEKDTKTALKAQLEDIGELINISSGKQKTIAIAARNKWSTARIRNDYAAGIRELDQDCAEEADGDNFDPSASNRDYRHVADSLPVFCISSRAYQALNGRFDEMDAQNMGYNTLAETGIPQLIAHCIKMTELNRIARNRSFMGEVTNLLLSLSLWSSGDNASRKLSAEQRGKERRLLKCDLKVLRSRLGKAVDVAVRDIREAQADNIEKSFAKAQRLASRVAGKAADKWGASVRDGGVHWGTYRAIIRRNGGPYESRAGSSYDFNKDLSALYEKFIASGWEHCFQYAIPKKLQNLGASQGEALDKFHQQVAARASTYGNGVGGIQVMTQKLGIWQDRCRLQGDRLITRVQELQKGIYRDIAPVIRDGMGPTYEYCATLSGKDNCSKVSHISLMCTCRQRLYETNEESYRGRRQGKF